MERVRFERVAWAIGYALALVLMFCLICALAACDRPAYADSEERGNGQPLDAVSYDAPTWFEGAHKCWRVTDRQTGQSWWLIAVWDGTGGIDYVTLPIGEVGADADAG